MERRTTQPNGLRTRVDQGPQLGRALTGSSFGDPPADTHLSWRGPGVVLTVGRYSRTFVRTHKESRWQLQLVSKSGSARKAKPRSPSPLTWSTSRSAILSALQPKTVQNRSCVSTSRRLACLPRSSTASSKPWMTQLVQVRRFNAPHAARGTSSLADRCFTLRRSIPTFSGSMPSTPASRTTRWGGGRNESQGAIELPQSVTGHLDTARQLREQAARSQ